MTISFDNSARISLQPVSIIQPESYANRGNNDNSVNETEFEQKSNLLMKKSLKSLNANDGLSKEKENKNDGSTDQEVIDDFMVGQVTKAAEANKAAAVKAAAKAKAKREEDNDDEGEE